MKTIFFCFFFLCFIGVLVACGGASGPTQEDPPPDNGSDPSNGDLVAGRLFLENNTLYVIETVYLNEVDPEQPQIIRSHVNPGERHDVGRMLLPAGWAFELDVVVLVPAQVGFSVRRKAQILIDGEQVMQVRIEDANDPFSVQLEL